MKIYSSVTQLIGRTPLVEPKNYNSAHKTLATVLAKIEYFNPSGSIKDRAVLQMILDAEESGELKPGATLIEPTSGNTGIGICAIAAQRGYKAVIVMPETMSNERKLLMKAYGAQLVLTPGSKGMAGSIEKAKEIRDNTPGSLIMGQFSNPSNARAHILSTGPEIWDDTDGKVDILVAGVGTGGTITGIGEYLKSKNPNIKVVAVEPATSPLLSKGVAGPHGLQGIGANFVPKLLNRDIYDEVMTITDEEAYATGREFAQTEGFLVGITSGAALCAATKLSLLPENKGKVIVAIMPDTGERYLSTKMFSD